MRPLHDCSRTGAILLPAADPYKHFIQMPRTSKARLTPLSFGRIPRPELQTPATDCRVRDLYAALGEKILDIAEAQGEAVEQPRRVADDLRWEPMPTISMETEYASRHSARAPVNVTMPPLSLPIALL